MVGDTCYIYVSGHGQSPNTVEGLGTHHRDYQCGVKSSSAYILDKPRKCGVDRVALYAVAGLYFSDALCSFA